MAISGLCDEYFGLSANNPNRLKSLLGFVFLMRDERAI
jgi:hypothetical protein